jgi:HTH-type transcriptional regulator/antitoxin HigA
MEALMDRQAIEEITARFEALSSMVPLHVIRTEQSYDRAVSVLNQLLDAGGADEDSALAGLVSSLGSLIADYDDAHQPAQASSPIANLRFLMEQNRLKQSDLPEIGTQGVVSEVLRGKRELNVRQIKALSERFRVPPSLFI